MKDAPYIQLLLQQKLLNKRNLHDAYAAHGATGKSIETILVEDEGAVAKQALLDAKAAAAGVQAVDLTAQPIDVEAARVIPQAMSQRYRVLCFGGGAGKIHMAMEDPSDVFAIEYVKMRTGLEVLPRVCYAGDLDSALKTVYSMSWEPPAPSAPPATPASPPPPVKPASAAPASRPRMLNLAGVPGPPPPIAPAPPGPASAAPSNLPVASRSPAPAPPPPLDEVGSLTLLSRAAASLNSLMDERMVVAHMLDIAVRLVRAEGASLLLVEPPATLVFYKSITGDRGPLLEQRTLPLSNQSIAGWVVLNNAPLLVNDVSAEPRHSVEMDAVIGFHTRSVLCVPVRWGSQMLGALEVVNKMDGDFTAQDQDYLNILAAQSAVAIHNSIAIDELRNFYVETVEILIDCLQALDPVSKDHIMDVSRLATAMARILALDPKDLEQLCYAAFLHDIGKIKVTGGRPMEEHPVLGAQMLQQVKLFRDIIPAVRAHHERWDGTGYPDKLRGEAIPLRARILAVAEAFCEGLTGVPFEEHEWFRSRFLEQFGTAFDPGLKTPFLESLRTVGPLSVYKPA